MIDKPQPKETSETTKLLTVAETGRLLAISRATLFRLARRGELKPIRIGGCRRYHPSDITRFVRNLPR